MGQHHINFDVYIYMYKSLVTEIQSISVTSPVVSYPDHTILEQYVQN